MAEVEQLNAKVKLFLNTKEVDFSKKKESITYDRDISYPIEYDDHNRRGQNWHVLDLDLESIYGVFRFSSGSIDEVRIANPFSKVSKFVDKHTFLTGRRTIYLADLYYYLYDEIDFKFKLFDENDNEVDSVDFTLERETEETRLYFSTGTYIDLDRGMYRKDRTSFAPSNLYLSTMDEERKDGYEERYERYSNGQYDPNCCIRKIVYKLKHNGEDAIPEDVKKIKLYVNDRLLEAGISFFEKSLGSSNKIDSFEMMNEHRFIPVTFYDNNGEKIDYVKLEYLKLYDGSISSESNDFTYTWNYYYDYSAACRNLLDIVQLGDLNVLDQCKYIGFMLSIDAEVDYSSIICKDGLEKGNAVDPEKVKDISKYLYIGDTEVSCEKFICNDDVQKIEMLGHIKMQDESFYINIKHSSEVDLHLLPISLYTYTRDFDLVNLSSEMISSTITGLFNDSSRIKKVENKNFYDDSTGKKMPTLKQKLMSIHDESNEEVQFESYTWKADMLEVTLREPKSYSRLTFEFRSLFSCFQKDDIVVDNIDLKDFHPNLYIFENDNAYSKDYLYIHKELDTYIYFSEPLDLEKQYRIQLIDFQRIYKFNVHQINSFYKEMRLTFNGLNTSDGIDDNLRNVSLSISSKSRDDASEYILERTEFNQKEHQEGWSYRRVL